MQGAQSGDDQNLPDVDMIGIRQSIGLDQRADTDTIQSGDAGDGFARPHLVLAQGRGRVRPDDEHRSRRQFIHIGD